MVWDLRGAMLKKQEVETARLQDFAFRHRARTMRLLAAAIGPDVAAEDLVGEIALRPDEAILDRLAARLGMPLRQVAALHAQCAVAARAQLIAEIGDPTPHRLA